MGEGLGVRASSSAAKQSLEVAWLGWRVSVREKVRKISYMPLQPFGYLLFKLYFRLRGVGVEHIPKEGPGIIAPNHVSYADPPLVAALVPRMLHFMMLHEHYYHPYFHWLFKRLPCIPIRQGRVNAESLKESLQVLESGELLCVFPEGGRSKDNRLMSPMPGVALLALKTEAPVIPAGINGGFEAYGPHLSFPRPKRVTINFGPPLIFKKEENPSKERLREVSQEIMERIGALLDKKGA